VFFNAMGITYKYEHEGYELKAGRYLPDFYLPEHDCFVEIKGEKPTKDEKAKMAELSEKSGSMGFICWDLPMSYDGNGHFMEPFNTEDKICIPLGECSRNPVCASQIDTHRLGDHNVVCPYCGFPMIDMDKPSVFNIDYGYEVNWPVSCLDCDKDFIFQVVTNGGRNAVKVINTVQWGNTLYQLFAANSDDMDKIFDRLFDARDTARQARFEHGQCG
jgi:hypothetical protein